MRAAALLLLFELALAQQWTASTAQEPEPEPEETDEQKAARFEASCGNGEIARALGIAADGTYGGGATCGNVTRSDGTEICDELSALGIKNLTEDVIGAAHAIDPDDAAACSALNYLRYEMLAVFLVLICCGYPLAAFCVAYMCCMRPRGKKGYAPSHDAWKACSLVLVLVFWGLGIVGNVVLPVIALMYCYVQGPCCMVLPFCIDACYKTYDEDSEAEGCQTIIKPCLPIGVYGTEIAAPIAPDDDAQSRYCGPCTCCLWLVAALGAPVLFYFVAEAALLDESTECFDKLASGDALPPTSEGCNSSLIAVGLLAFVIMLALCLKPLDTLGDFPPKLRRGRGLGGTIAYMGGARLSDESVEVP